MVFESIGIVQIEVKGKFGATVFVDVEMVGGGAIRPQRLKLECLRLEQLRPEPLRCELLSTEPLRPEDFGMIHMINTLYYPHSKATGI